ncbi:MAG: hypothetical protein JSW39_22410 [Desulfobacterales bacterium]|nr:MAG: hypothetical protein JSW39_22410 [Desulfobacterales bacterium]
MDIFFNRRFVYIKSEPILFCRMHPGRILPYKGEQRRAQITNYSRIDTYPGTNKQIPGGIQLLRANVTYFKALAAKLQIAPADPGAGQLYGETSAESAGQMTAEVIGIKFWAWRLREAGMAATMKNKSSRMLIGTDASRKYLHNIGKKSFYKLVQIGLPLVIVDRRVYAYEKNAIFNWVSTNRDG